MNNQQINNAYGPLQYEIEDEDEDDDFDYDVWDPDEYGYADADASFVGTDTFEDQKGMEELKAYLKIPNQWILLKVVNFDKKKLVEMEKWLAENCKSKFERVGWRSSCSTKVGVAFESANDALFYRLRWQ